MAGVRTLHEGAALPRPVEIRGDVGAADLSSADLSNVVPFARLRAMRQVPEVKLSSEATRPATGVPYDRMRFVAFAALSLMVHAGLLLALSREPAPLASIGEQVISLEIVVGATAPAGVAQTPGEQEAQAAAAPEPQQPETPREPEEKATEQPQTVQVAPQEKAPEQAAKPETPVEPEVTAETPQPMPPAPKPQQPKQAQQPKPAKERRRIDAPTREHAGKQAKASAPSTAANSVGVGRSDANSNYAGLVSAHLRRHQQYPADARGRGEQGVATVSFSLDGGGRVNSARLVRGSGVASIDAEVQAMVRRASPFPAPPSGRGISFTVPVRFRLN